LVKNNVNKFNKSRHRIARNYGVIMGGCLIAVGVGDVVECAASLSNVAKLAAHPKFVWVFNASCDGTIIYNDPVLIQIYYWTVAEELKEERRQN
jgi:hypothetical protein